MADCKSNELIYRRDDLNDQILAFEIRGVIVEPVDPNQYVPNAKVLLETFMSDIKGAPHKDAQDLTDYTRLSFPNMKHQDDVTTLNMWNMFTFLLDDFLESQTTKLEYWVRYLGFYAETEMVKTGDHMPTLDEYDALRIVDCGYIVMQVFLYGSAKFDPDDYPEIVTDEAWTMFNTWAARHFYYVNDLYSSKKEILLHQGKYTLIYIIMCNYKCDAQGAADKLVDMIDGAWTLAIKYGDALRSHNIPLLHQYVTDIVCFLKGHLYWSTITPRYNKLSLYDNYQLQP
ncbi:unnamed protein product [Oppiella nova]|uniref:Terpene synthase n=1 Tax=Oppiella nova TaxID=334625 RepID=A0A7R9QHH6_9ACAR|nr:unnamed protein product [Oppiella nova]CAG2165855.1 unnamed protein product [Oppiella nova]